MNSLRLVFVHGYSVSNFDTYGELPIRMREEGTLRGFDVQVENVFLGRYITFSDEVRIDDVSIALETAVNEQLDLSAGKRFVCITHSTGGPVVRNWWQNFYINTGRACPMSHLVMLAPANHGSALAQLGKSKLSRMKSWLDGVEPGQNILDWLELGSDDACSLNKSWIMKGAPNISGEGVFLFILTGQDIDRKLYDHINSYTGEVGSDGVVRTSSANLNSRYIQVVQPDPKFENGKLISSALVMQDVSAAPKVPFRILAGKSHSNTTMGIMKSVTRHPADVKNKDTIDTIFDCIAVKNKSDYSKLYERFKEDTEAVQRTSKLESANLPFIKYFIHDRCAMIIFRVSDSAGQLMNNFDLVLTAGDNDPDSLPPGFFVDRQCNLVNRSVITYYFNYDLITGSPAIIGPGGEVVRHQLNGINRLGLILKPRPENGFIHYLPCRLEASEEFLKQALQPNSTTLVDICLKRIVNSEVFRFEKTGDAMPVVDFEKIKPGRDIS